MTESAEIRAKLEAIDGLLTHAPDDVLRTEIHRVIQAGDFARCQDCYGPLWDNERFCPWCKAKQDPPDNPADYAEGFGISSELSKGG